MYKIILASESPRRREIMDTMGIAYEIMVANIKEEVEETRPDQMVEALAKKKVRFIAEGLPKEQEVIILGADTMVFSHGEALGKPRDSVDAARMLQLLSNDVHEVYTGVHIIIRRKGREDQALSFAVATRVHVNPISPEEMRDYIASGEPMDKAGAYGIQGGFGIFIDSIEGDYYNIVGLPISRIHAELLGIGIDIKKIK